MVHIPFRAVDLVELFLGYSYTRGVRAILLVHIWCSFADGSELRILVRSDCKSTLQSLKAVSDVPFYGVL